MSGPPLGKLVFLNLHVTAQASTYKLRQSTLVSGSWLDVALQLQTLLFEKPKTITVSHNRQSRDAWTGSISQFIPLQMETKLSTASPRPLRHPPAENTPISVLCPGDVCQDGLHTKNKQASHCNSKRNGCGFGRGGRRREEGWNGKKGGWVEAGSGYT